MADSTPMPIVAVDQIAADIQAAATALAGTEVFQHAMRAARLQSVAENLLSGKWVIAVAASQAEAG